MFVDNYANHYNGRIWMNWDSKMIDVRVNYSSSQLIYRGLYDLAGKFLFWITAIYAANTLDQRRRLWNEIEDIYNRQQGPWLVLGDFNNYQDIMTGLVLRKSLRLSCKIC